MPKKLEPTEKADAMYKSADEMYKHAGKLRKQYLKPHYFPGRIMDAEKAYGQFWIVATDMIDVNAHVLISDSKAGFKLMLNKFLHFVRSTEFLAD